MMHATEHAALSTQFSCHKEHSSQDRPEYELSDIFMLYGKEYRKNHTLTPEQGKSMYAIEHCRTCITPSTTAMPSTTKPDGSN